MVDSRHFRWEVERSRRLQVNKLCTYFREPHDSAGRYYQSGAARIRMQCGRRRVREREQGEVEGSRPGCGMHHARMTGEQLVQERRGSLIFSCAIAV
jgi:hypothetical protein